MPDGNICIGLMEAFKAKYRSFVRLGSRPEQLVIDQDAVIVASETYGDVVVKANVFEAFYSK